MPNVEVFTRFHALCELADQAKRKATKLTLSSSTAPSNGGRYIMTEGVETVDGWMYVWKESESDKKRIVLLWLKVSASENERNTQLSDFDQKKKTYDLRDLIIKLLFDPV
jgi:hypothetical protein